MTADMTPVDWVGNELPPPAEHHKEDEQEDEDAPKNKDEVVPNKETAPENVCILVGFQDVIEVPKKSNIKFRAAATAVK